MTSESEIEDQRESVVYGALLIAIQMTGRRPESLWIDNDSLLDQDASVGAADIYRRAKALARAAVAVGATNVGLRSRNSSACTITA
ncbi:MAG: hypothetical protein QOH12_360 [Solirubrobacteraceae bacterium]|nr:hypothetical protein [Solirubrobacteraceae bacterium]